MDRPGLLNRQERKKNHSPVKVLRNNPSLSKWGETEAREVQAMSGGKEGKSCSLLGPSEGANFSKPFTGCPQKIHHSFPETS